MGVPVSGWNTLQLLGCGPCGCPQSLNPWSYGWGTSHSSIAQTPSTGNIQGISAGSTWAFASVNVNKGPQMDFCPLEPDGGSTSVEVTPPPSFNVAYRAYIPIDHVDGPTPCLFEPLGLAVTKKYKGDPGPMWTYRTNESVWVTPATQQSFNFFAVTGETRSYGYQSPVNGSTLSSSDEDGIPSDCYRWHLSAGPNFNAGFAHSVTYPNPQQAQVHFAGASPNPLESSIAKIEWSMRTIINVASNNASATAYVNYNHTCYPAHQVMVNNVEVYSFSPESHDPGHIWDCLVFNSTNKIVGEQTQPKSVPIQ